MRNTRRLATIGLAIVATGALLAGTAGADTPQVTAGDTGGTAQANALTISIAGQTITGSAANALLDLGKLADATGTQVLTPALTSAPAHATSTKIGVTDVQKPASCNGSQLTAIPGINRFDITCGQATAGLTADGGSSRALGAELALEPSVSNVLSTLSLQDTAKQTVSQVEQALDPLVQALTQTPLKDLVTSADQTVQDVLSKILTLQSTARIVVAPALAEVTSDATSVTSHAHAQGIRIELLPVDGAGATNNLLPNDLSTGKPLITITIGNAECGKTVSKDNSFAAKVDCTAAVATVEFGSPTVAQALGVPSTITVQGGQQLCIPGLTGTPLETCINVASTGVDANGNPYADGASIELFKGVNGGIDLSTGKTTASAAAVALPVAAPASATPDLPRTGGNGVLPIVGGGLLAVALVTRRFALGRR